MTPRLPVKKNLTSIMEVLCTVFQIMGVIIVASLPWSLNNYLLFKNSYVTKTTYISMFVLLVLSGICAFCILGQARKVLRNINNKNPFTYDTANRIKYISYWCLPIAAAYTIAIYFIPSVFVVLVGLTFLFLSACILIIARLFYQAVSYKEENDLTI